MNERSELEALAEGCLPPKGSMQREMAYAMWDETKARIIAALLDVAHGGMIVANEAIRERDAARAALRHIRNNIEPHAREIAPTISGWKASMLLSAIDKALLEGRNA